MSANHTPGPWRIVIDDDGNRLSGRPSIHAHEDLDCTVVHWDGFEQTYWQSARGEKEMHANARLIAAAPELLETLEYLARRPTQSNQWLDEVLEVIAKATGQDAQA